jgi:hypothetical protein
MDKCGQSKISVVKRSGLLVAARVLMTFLLTHAAFKSSGQERRFVHLDARQGLSHTHVKAIYRDVTGFLWIGTESASTALMAIRSRFFATMHPIQHHFSTTILPGYSRCRAAKWVL